MTREFIPQIMPWIDEDEVKEVTDAIRSTYISEHTKTREFEKKCQEFIGAAHVTTCSNATCGLFSALKALGIGEGDEVIVPNYTFIATANVVVMAGATPVFCDVDADTMMMTPECIKPHLSEKTKAIMPVHMYAQPADMDALVPFAKEHNLYVIEDAAQGFGSFYNGKHVGTFGDIGVFAFYANKTITTAEGGLIVTNDASLIERSIAMKNHGRTEKGTFWHPYIGMNFKFTDLQAALGLAQLRKLPTIIERKKQFFARYSELLADCGAVRFPEVVTGAEPFFWFMNIFVDDPKALIAHLKKHQIGAREFFPPLHQQPAYESLSISGGFPNSEKIYKHGVSLPSYAQLSDDDIVYVCDTIRSFYTS